MADNVVPHFHNDPGVSVIEIGAREVMCIGAKPPFDHPHVFLDMGDDHEIICLYCSTFYRHNPALDAHAELAEELALMNPYSLASIEDVRSAVVNVLEDHLWSLQFGNNGPAGPANTLFFTAGIGNEKHGLFGSLQAVPAVPPRVRLPDAAA